MTPGFNLLDYTSEQLLTYCLAIQLEIDSTTMRKPGWTAKELEDLQQFRVKLLEAAVQKQIEERVQLK